MVPEYCCPPEEHTHDAGLLCKRRLASATRDADFDSMQAHELANAFGCRGKLHLAETTLGTAMAKHQQQFGRDTRSQILVLQELASWLDAQDRSDEAEVISAGCSHFAIRSLVRIGRRHRTAS
jgi:predicted aconitase